MSSKTWFLPQRSAGDATRQAHADMPKGTFERELGRDGFFGPASHMYHRNPPTGWVEWEGPLRPRAFDLNDVQAPASSPLDAARILENSHCKYRFWRTVGAMDHLVRNSDGDDLLFLHRGKGEFFCDYGHMSVEQGDYLVIPRGTMWRLEAAGMVEALLIEATGGAYSAPDKGMVGRHAIYDPAILDAPAIDDAFLAQQGPGRWQVRVKRRNQVSVVTYPFNPLDAVGWKGDLSVVRLNVRDIRPLMSHRYHLPPSAHTTFVADRFVVCTFAPRPMESDPEALKVPFFHNNDDYDEVIFYHEGDFFSRDNIEAGMVTFHPAGFTHGPHPKALDGMLTPKKAFTDEYAVMIDTRDALDLGPDAAATENEAYVRSWRASAGRGLDGQEVTE